MTQEKSTSKTGIFKQLGCKIANFFENIFKDKVMFGMLCFTIIAIVFCLCYFDKSAEELLGENGKLKEHLDLIQQEVKDNGVKIVKLEQKVDDNKEQINEIHKILINGFEKD